MTDCKTENQELNERNAHLEYEIEWKSKRLEGLYDELSEAEDKLHSAKTFARQLNTELEQSNSRADEAEVEVGHLQRLLMEEKEAHSELRTDYMSIIRNLGSRMGKFQSDHKKALKYKAKLNDTELKLNKVRVENDRLHCSLCTALVQRTKAESRNAVR